MQNFWFHLILSILRGNVLYLHLLYVASTLFWLKFDQEWIIQRYISHKTQNKEKQNIKHRKRWATLTASKTTNKNKLDWTVPVLIKHPLYFIVFSQSTQDMYVIACVISKYTRHVFYCVISKYTRHVFYCVISKYTRHVFYCVLFNYTRHVFHCVISKYTRHVFYWASLMIIIDYSDLTGGTSLANTTYTGADPEFVVRGGRE